MESECCCHTIVPIKPFEIEERVRRQIVQGKREESERKHESEMKVEEEIE